ncbi:MAG: response regulator [Sandaracinaceae bacterium]
MAEELRDEGLEPAAPTVRRPGLPRPKALSRAALARVTSLPTAPAPPTPRRSVPRRAAERVQGVLVVEDDPDTQWRLARTLAIRNRRVVGTSSAEAALEVLREWRADAVLLDDSLPGISGVELASLLRVRVPEVRVVLMTSTARLVPPPDLVDGVVEKPVDTERLLAVMNALIGEDR